ncbi:MAG: hypothetical protein V4439_02355 [Patescibacteria group bacterium]
MKKIIYALCLIMIVYLISPVVAEASWWNPVSWFKKSTQLQKTMSVNKTAPIGKDTGKDYGKIVNDRKESSKKALNTLQKFYKNETKVKSQESANKNTEQQDISDSKESKPSIKLLSPSGGEVFYSYDDDIEFKWQTQNISPESDVWVGVHFPGTIIYSLVTSSKNDGIEKIFGTANEFNEGPAIISIEATDSKGNVIARDESTVSYKINKRTSSGIVNIISPTPGAVYNQGDQITIDFNTDSRLLDYGYNKVSVDLGSPDTSFNKIYYFPFSNSITLTVPNYSGRINVGIFVSKDGKSTENVDFNKGMVAIGGTFINVN